MKNSCGKSWDNDGYLQISTSGNVCGIGIGAACSKCYAKTADYGFKSCKEHVSSNGANPGASRRALALVLSIKQDWQALELVLVGQAAAFDALVTLAPCSAAHWASLAWR